MECEFASDCPPGQFCEGIIIGREPKCVPGCSTISTIPGFSSNCPAGEKCVVPTPAPLYFIGECKGEEPTTPKPDECTIASDCPPRYFCQKIIAGREAICIPGCSNLALIPGITSNCPEGEVCIPEPGDLYSIGECTVGCLAFLSNCPDGEFCQASEPTPGNPFPLGECKAEGSTTPKPEECIIASDCPPRYFCERVIAGREAKCVPGCSNLALIPGITSNCPDGEKCVVPTPAPLYLIGECKAGPSMKIEMCIMPGNNGRRQSAHLSINVVLINCKPWEICVKSDSNLLGNELGICTARLVGPRDDQNQWLNKGKK